MNRDEIRNRLLQTYSDADIEVMDLTGEGNHYQVSIQSKHFKGLTRIQQHQAVMSVFGPELKSGEVHALSIRTVVKE